MNRITVLALAIVTILVLGVGTVLAAPPSSPQMRAMHEQMPSELQAECDAMHAEMGAMHSQMGAGPGWMHGQRR
jgi:hypothetical protein